MTDNYFVEWVRSFVADKLVQELFIRSYILDAFSFRGTIRQLRWNNMLDNRYLLNKTACDCACFLFACLFFFFVCLLACL